MTWTFDREQLSLNFNGLTCAVLTGPGTSPRDRCWLGEAIADALNQAHVTIAVTGHDTAALYAPLANAALRESARELARKKLAEHREKIVATPAGLEPATPGLEIPCSIPLSYGAANGRTEHYRPPYPADYQYRGCLAHNSVGFQKLCTDCQADAVRGFTESQLANCKLAPRCVVSWGDGVIYELSGININAVQTQPGSVLDPEQWKEGA